MRGKKCEGKAGEKEKEQTCSRTVSKKLSQIMKSRNWWSSLEMIDSQSVWTQVVLFFVSFFYSALYPPALLFLYIVFKSWSFRETYESRLLFEEKKVISRSYIVFDLLL